MTPHQHLKIRMLGERTYSRGVAQPFATFIHLKPESRRGSLLIIAKRLAMIENESARAKLDQKACLNRPTLRRKSVSTVGFGRYGMSGG